MEALNTIQQIATGYTKTIYLLGIGTGILISWAFYEVCKLAKKGYGKIKDKL